MLEVPVPESRERPLRVGLVTFAPWAGLTGLHVRARAVAADLMSLGIHVSVLAVGAASDVSATQPSSTEEPSVTVVYARHWAARMIALAGRVRKMASGVDVLIIESAMFAPAVSCAKVRKPLIWDINALETLQYSRMPLTVRNRLLRAVWCGLERWAASRAAVAVAVSDEEADWCRRIHPALEDRMAVVRHRSSVLPGARDVRRSVSRGTRIVYVGAMAAKHNREAARWLIDDLSRLIHREVAIIFVGPGTENLFVGRRGLATYQALGSVPDLRTVITPEDLAVAPLASGAGVKTKVLDYLALGCRVVATPVALEGIPDPPGVVRASLEAMPAVLAELLDRSDSPRDRARRSRLQQKWLARHASPQSARAEWATVVEHVRTGVPRRRSFGASGD